MRPDAGGGQNKKGEQEGVWIEGPFQHGETSLAGWTFRFYISHRRRPIQTEQAMEDEDLEKNAPYGGVRRPNAGLNAEL